MLCEGLNYWWANMGRNGQWDKSKLVREGWVWFGTLFSKFFSTWSLPMMLLCAFYILNDDLVFRFFLWQRIFFFEKLMWVVVLRGCWRRWVARRHMPFTMFVRTWVFIVRCWVCWMLRRKRNIYVPKILSNLVVLLPCWCLLVQCTLWSPRYYHAHYYVVGWVSHTSNMNP